MLHGIEKDEKGDALYPGNKKKDEKTMEFAWNSDQEAVRQRAASFASEFLAPHAATWDQEESLPEGVLRACARSGLTGLTVPKEMGGPGESTVAYALAITELAAACSSTAVTVAVSSMVAETIASIGTPEQRERYLPSLLSGEFPAGSFALSEPGSGSDAGSLRTRAEIKGEQVYLNGEKSWITSGPFAGVFVVWARTGEGEGSRGVSTFLVEPSDPGFQVGRKEEKMGLRASPTVSLNFDDCRITSDRLFGEPGRGFRIAMQALDGGRIGVASQALGIARAAIDAVERYYEVHPHRRGAYEESRLAHMKSEFAAARLLILQAAWLKDEKKPFSAKAAMAKAYSTEAANTICQEALDLLGEDGCTNDYPVERLFRDVRVTTIYEGTSEVQRIVISRSFLSEAR